MSAPTLPELIERIRESGGSLTIELALTEIDRRLTALEARTAQLEDDRGPASDPRGE